MGCILIAAPSGCMARPFPQEPTMRHAPLILLVALTVLSWSACSKSAPATKPAAAPAAASPTPAAVPATQPAQPVAEVVADKAGAKADESDMVPAAERKSEVTKEECEKACAHATKLSMASMPPDATPEMRAAIEKALKESCPRDCLAKGTKALVECIMKAKSGMDLAAECQK